MPTGYEDIDNMNNQASQLYDQQMQEQRNIITYQEMFQIFINLIYLILIL